MDAVSALKASALFEGFTDTGLTILSGICGPKNFPAGVPLFVEGMLADSLFIVAEGRVQLAMKGSKGEAISMGELGPGDWLGELSLITTGQRQCTATAATPVMAFEIRQGDFQKLLGTKPQACIKLLMAICTQFGQKVIANKDALRSLVTK